ncbi:MAG TPA: cellulase family glycosylhydrolase [Solirubrobacterales bacterium]|nr:cellulase family glycosylhydrolase [Solirubrobacterales bacterium]
MSGIVRFVLIALAAVGVGGGHLSATPAPYVGVGGNHLVNESGRPVRLLGVNRSSGEYRCVQGYGIFEGPTDEASIAAIRSWGANAVRLPLNESCWLGIDGVPEEFSGAAYRTAVYEYAERLQQAGLYVILTLQFASPGEEPATEIIPMADAAHGPAFWTSVARTFRGDHGVLFDLYSEPHEISWECWRSGCIATTKKGTEYEAVGMGALIRAVRATGARQPLLLSGINYAHELTEWESHLPPDPRNAEVASLHTYDFAPCLETCRAGLAELAERHPVVTAELGETDCTHDYIDEYMAWADEHGVSYLGWAWNAGHGWTCNHGPALIRNYDGAPTPYGAGLKTHLQALRR